MPEGAGGDGYVTPEWWEPFVEELTHPDWWQVFCGVNHLYYGRRRNSSPPVVVRAETPLLLRDEIRKEDARFDLSRTYWHRGAHGWRVNT